MDKFIKFQSLTVIIYIILVSFCDFNFDTLTAISTLVIFFTFLIFIKKWKYSLNELSSRWKLNEEFANKQFKPKLTYKSKLLYHPKLSIKQLIPKPEDSSKQFKMQLRTWFIFGLFLISLFICQLIFYNFYIINQQTRFINLIIYFLFLILIENLFIKFLIFRNDLENYYTLQEHQTSLFIKLLILNSFICNSLPLLIKLFSLNSLEILDVLQSQLFVRLILDLIFNFFLPLLIYSAHRFIQFINDDKLLESKLVLKESSKGEFDDLIFEWIFVVQQFIYIVLFSTVYSKIILIVFLNLQIRNLINFLKLFLLYKRPLIESNCCANLVSDILEPIFIFSSILSLLNLDLYIYTDQLNLSITAQQFNMIIICLIFLFTFSTFSLPVQSIKSKNIKHLKNVEKFVLLRLQDENALNRTVDNVFEKSD